MSDLSKKGHFKLSKITPFEALRNAKQHDISESDLCFQDKENIYQFEYVKPEDPEKYIIEPGVYTMSNSGAGLELSKMSLKKRNLLESVLNTSLIMNEAKTFFNKLHVYEELGRDKKRAILISSSPGCGKTAAINAASQLLIKEDAGTVVLNWPTSNVDADNVAFFFSAASEYSKKCTRLILVMEDIGGGEKDTSHERGVSAGLLNLLDGLSVAFQLPTFIIATTNFPEHLLENLADRPERFDLMIELSPPKLEERIELTEFIAKRKLTAEEKKALSRKEADKFSIAHLVEVVVRSRLHDKTIPKVVDELVKHSKRFAKNFKDGHALGIGNLDG